MQNVWNTSVPPHEKVKLFTKELNKFRSLLKQWQAVKVQIHEQVKTVKPLYETSTQETTTNEMGVLFKNEQKKIV